MSLIDIYSKNKFLFHIFILISTLILISYGILQMLIINICTFIYLTYKTITLLENDNNTSENINLVYISYLKKWTCYACYVMTETICDILFKFIPFATFYYISKMIIFIWIIQSDHNIDSIYKRWILDYYHSYKNTFDEICEIIEMLVDGCRLKLNNYISESIGKIKNMIKTFIRELFKEGVLDSVSNMPNTMDNNL